MRYHRLQLCAGELHMRSCKREENIPNSSSKRRLIFFLKTH